MKYLRSLMQQSVTACKNQAKLIQQFTLSLLYLLIIHIVALLFFFLFRLVLFTSIDYQFPPDIQNNFLMQATAFIKGLWFDNVIACYILLLPLVILWITALCNYHSKWVFRFISIFFLLFSLFIVYAKSCRRLPAAALLSYSSSSETVSSFFNPSFSGSCSFFPSENLFRKSGTISRIFVRPS